MCSPGIGARPWAGSILSRSQMAIKRAHTAVQVGEKGRIGVELAPTAVADVDQGGHRPDG